ncbi:MAG: YrrS family protein [Ectobacillus sp.]
MTQFPDSSRFEAKKQKRRKWMLLNLLIGAVLLVVAAVAYQVFSSPEEQAATKGNESIKQQTESTKSSEKEESKKKEKTDRETETTAKEKAVTVTQPVEDKKVIIQDQQDPKVAEAYTNPSWKPIGTSQSEPHSTQFDMNSQDWKEMVESIAYALNIPSDTLTILFLGNNGPNKAIGTVQEKGTKQVYKVYIEWVENEGWQPTLVQQMK